ncbi:hypothetical protein ACJW30_04G018700 [Castanea mollissima]
MRDVLDRSFSCSASDILAERKAYEVVVQDGKLIFNHSGEFLHIARGLENAKWIFVLSQNSSFC